MVRRLGRLALLMTLTAVLPAVANDYPNKPIRAIAAQGPGGLSDVFMRALADQLGPEIGETVVVENRVGASGSIGARACADSEPDGYTICILNNESMVINPLIFTSQNFDPTSLTHVTRLFYLQHVFAVNASLNVKTLDQLAALAKSQPKTMNYLTPSLSKVAFMEAFNKKYGIDFVRVPFKGGGDAVNSMMTGTTPVAIFGIGNLIQLIRAGKVVGLAVDGDTRSPLAPEIPTFKELGYTVHVWASSFGMHVPVGTPKPIVDKLHDEITMILRRPDIKQAWEKTGATPIVMTQPELKNFMEAQVAKWAEVIKTNRIAPIK